MGVTADTMAVTHPFQVETEIKLAVVVCHGDIYSLPRRFIDHRVDPEPFPNLQLWGRVRVRLFILLPS